jgi:hypothetical protein
LGSSCRDESKNNGALTVIGNHEINALTFHTNVHLHTGIGVQHRSEYAKKAKREFCDSATIYVHLLVNMPQNMQQGESAGRQKEAATQHLKLLFLKTKIVVL